jgi:hypothetical protein
MLSAKDIKAIGDLIDTKINAIQPKPEVTEEVVPDTAGKSTEEDDPALESLFISQSKLQLQMADPVYVTMRGRYGSTRVNQTLENLEAVNAMIEKRRTRNSRARF